jgi:hypothetical protein
MMDAVPKQFARVVWTAFAAVSLCAFSSGIPAASGSDTPRARSGGKVPLRISVEDKDGIKIAGSDVRDAASSATSAVLAFDRAYRAGDRIVIRGPQRIAVRLDKSMPECLLFLADSSLGEFDYEVPSGRSEQETGSAYAPDGFAGKFHRVTVRALDRNERTGYRNLALNPCDVLRPEEGPASVFPHSSTNSYSRNLFDFAARNAIDGMAQNGHHGVWPCQSWGPGLRGDLWWKLDFGRLVEVDNIRLMVRADYPHDSYWNSAVVEFSDGSLLPIGMSSSAEFQAFDFSKRKITWFRITKLVAENPAKWCGFVEVEAWGHDLK